MSRKTSPKKPVPDIPEVVPSLTISIGRRFHMAATGRFSIVAGVLVSVARVSARVVALVALGLGRHFGLW